MKILKIAYLTAGLISGLILGTSYLTYGAGPTPLAPILGGTGISTTTAGNVGKNLYVVSANASGVPVYGFQTNGSGAGSSGVSSSTPFTSGDLVVASGTSQIITTSSVFYLASNPDAYITTSTNNFGGLTGNGTQNYIPYYNSTTGFMNSSVFTFTSSTGVLAAPSGTFSGTLTVGSLNGLLKGTTGVVGTATNGTDFTLISNNTCTGGQHVSSVSPTGTQICSLDNPSSTITTLPVPIANGGLATGTIPSNEEILVGNGSGYDLRKLTAGANITFTTTTKEFQIAAAAGGGGAATNTIPYDAVFPNNSQDDVFFINGPNAATLTRLSGINQVAGDTVTFNLYYCTAMNTATSTCPAAFAAASSSNSVTTPSITTSFASSSIPANAIVRLIYASASSTYFQLTAIVSGI